MTQRVSFLEHGMQGAQWQLYGVVESFSIRASLVPGIVAGCVHTCFLFPKFMLAVSKVGNKEALRSFPNSTDSV